MLTSVKAADAYNFVRPTEVGKQKLSRDRINHGPLGYRKSLNEILRACDNRIAVCVQGSGYDLATLMQRDQHAVRRKYR